MLTIFNTVLFVAFILFVLAFTVIIKDCSVNIRLEVYDKEVSTWDRIKDSVGVIIIGAIFIAIIGYSIFL